MVVPNILENLNDKAAEAAEKKIKVNMGSKS